MVCASIDGSSAAKSYGSGGNLNGPASSAAQTTPGLTVAATAAAAAPLSKVRRSIDGMGLLLGGGGRNGALARNHAAHQRKTAADD